MAAVELIDTSDALTVLGQAITLARRHDRTPLTGNPRLASAQRSEPGRDLSRAAQLCRLAAELLDTEYWRTRGYPDPLLDPSDPSTPTGGAHATRPRRPR
jgi:hypothetical protein